MESVTSGLEQLITTADNEVNIYKILINEEIPSLLKERRVKGFTPLTFYLLRLRSRWRNKQNLNTIGYQINTMGVNQ